MPARLTDTLRADLAANAEDPKAKLVVVAFRLASSVSRWSRLGTAHRVAAAPALVAYRVLVNWLLGVELPSSTSVGPGLRLRHGQGLVVNAATVLGSDVMLRQGVTIGNVRRSSGPSGCPVVGDGVEFGANSVVVGDITIGEGAVIGAGCVVTCDVPAGALVRPARPEVVER